MSQERPRWETAFALTEQERLYDFISDKRFQELLADEATTVHQIEVATNNYGEFLFVTMSRAAGEGSAYVRFWGLGFHELRERWLTNEWRFYEFQQFPRQNLEVIAPQEAQALVRDRRDEIAPSITPSTQSKRAQLFELLADLTDEDGAYTELEDLGWPDDDME